MEKQSKVLYLFSLSLNGNRCERSIIKSVFPLMKVIKITINSEWNIRELVDYIHLSVTCDIKIQPTKFISIEILWRKLIIHVKVHVFKFAAV